jgi:hypothetical protein
MTKSGGLEDARFLSAEITSRANVVFLEKLVRNWCSTFAAEPALLYGESIVTVTGTGVKNGTDHIIQCYVEHWPGSMVVVSKVGFDKPRVFGLDARRDIFRIGAIFIPRPSLCRGS